MTIENLKKIDGNAGKANKWDKIKKKYSSNINLSSDTVKKFLELNFVSEKADKILKGGEQVCSMEALNPAVIMDLRHEMVSE